MPGWPAAADQLLSDNDKNMSSSRYWPPTSPEDLKTRAGEASVRIPDAVYLTSVGTGITMVDRDCFCTTFAIYSGWPHRVYCASRPPGRWIDARTQLNSE